jgi:predicted acyltransferase
VNSRRLASLDAFRGLTIAGMILVNNPGSWKHVYSPLRHAEWHGWTPTDLVFPFFVFIVGVSIALALSPRISAGAKKAALYAKILKRSLIIFSLGILLHLIPRFNLSTLRIPGVLQRIALCYLFAALLYVNWGPRGRAGAVLLVLVSYWLIMKLVPVPGYGAGILDYQGNLCGYVDTKLLSGHLYKPKFDPEGILSTLPAIATALLGTLAGDWLRTKRKGASAKTAGLFASGLALTFLGLGLRPYFPINKQLWTSTYVLLTAGLALLLLAIFYLLIDAWKIKQWATPFIIFGTNAITAYVGSSLLVKLLLEVKVSSGGETVGLLSFVYQHAFVPVAGDLNGSLLYAVTYVLLWLALMTPLYLKKIYIKI